LEDNLDYSGLVKTMLEQAGLAVEVVLVGNLADFTTALEQQVLDSSRRFHAARTSRSPEIARQKC
jgi:hypothetical protein